MFTTVSVDTILHCQKLLYSSKVSCYLKKVKVANFYEYCQSQARLKPKRCLVGFIFTLEIIIIIIIKINNKTTFVSYLNSPRKGCPKGKKFFVWIHLGLIKWKTTSKKIRNGRRPPKKNGRRTPKKNGRRPQKKMKTTKSTIKKINLNWL